MNSAELLKAGKLTDARVTLIDEVKANPGSSELRMLLVKVLLFMGEWDKALRHIDIVSMNATGEIAEIAFLRNLIAAEKIRLEVFQNKRVPDFMTDPPLFLSEFLTAREQLVSGNAETFSTILPEIEESLLSLSGSVNGERFEGMTDIDATLFPFLEVFIHDSYLWFPFTALRELSVQPPTSLLDLLWIPSRIVTWDGLTTECVLPVLYSGSGEHVDDNIRIGRLTDWVELANGYSRGLGQHIFLLGDDEKGVLELRELTIDAPLQEQN
jgi:type VI secretion system protein ImpE